MVSRWKHNLYGNCNVLMWAVIILACAAFQANGGLHWIDLITACLQLLEIIWQVQLHMVRIQIVVNVQYFCKAIVAIKKCVCFSLSRM